MNEPAVKEALWTREFFGMSLVSFLIYLTQYAMIAALPIVMMQEYGGGDVEAGLAMTFFQIGTVAARPCAGILFFAYGSVLTFIPLYTRSLGLSAETSLFYACYAGAILVTRPFVGRIFDRMGPDATVYPGVLLFAVGMALLGSITGLTGLIGAALLLGAGFGAVTPALQTLAVRSVPASRAGVATATYFWSLDISVGLAAAGLGIVAVTYGYAFTYRIVDVVVIIIAALCYTIWRRMGKKE